MIRNQLSLINYRSNSYALFDHLLTFPLLDVQLSALEALVVRLSLGLVVGVVVLREVRVGQCL